MGSIYVACPNHIPRFNWFESMWCYIFRHGNHHICHVITITFKICMDIWCPDNIFVVLDMGFSPEHRFFCVRHEPTGHVLSWSDKEKLLLVVTCEVMDFILSHLICIMHCHVMLYFVLSWNYFVACCHANYQYHNWVL